MGEADGKLYHYNLEIDKLTELGDRESIKSISHFIQPKINSENLHYFLGSGCSYPAINLMGETFKEIKPDLKKIDQNILGEFGSEDNPDSKNIEAYLDWL